VEHQCPVRPSQLVYPLAALGRKGTRNIPLYAPRGALFLLRDGGANLRHSWQKEKCESESALGDTRRGYSVNCTPARLTTGHGPVTLSISSALRNA
jgi:hypothetical protein